jgi:hypothetical protein
MSLLSKNAKKKFENVLKPYKRLDLQVLNNMQIDHNERQRLYTLHQTNRAYYANRLAALACIANVEQYQFNKTGKAIMFNPPPLSIEYNKDKDEAHGSKDSEVNLEPEDLNYADLDNTPNFTQVTKVKLSSNEIVPIESSSIMPPIKKIVIKRVITLTKRLTQKITYKIV